MGEYIEKQQKSGRKQFLQRQVKQSKRRNAVPKLIPRAIAQEFEQKTGYSSANIRVSESDMPDLFGAKAAVQGNEIHFPRGRYQPETAEGRKILKHEMRHIIQQARNQVFANADGVVNDEKAKEDEADRGFEGIRASVGNIGANFSSDVGHLPVQCCGGSKKPHHKMEGELLRDGEMIFSGSYTSGGGPGGYRAGLAVHTERKFLDQVLPMVQEGDTLRMRGQLPPCRPGCQPAIREAVQNSQIRTEYTSEQTGDTYSCQPYHHPSLSGTVRQRVTKPDGTLISDDRYWQDKSHRWRKASLMKLERKQNERK